MEKSIPFLSCKGWIFDFIKGMNWLILETFQASHIQNTLSQSRDIL